MRAGRTVVALLGFSLFVGCNGQQTAGPRTGPTGPDVAGEDKSRCDPTGKREVKLDLNRDDKADVWNLYSSHSEGGSKVDVLTCKAVDLNFDGRRDLWKYFDERGNLTMEEMDLDFDGKVDMVTIRRGGKIVRQEMDTNYDGKPDIWKHFEEEALARVDRDSNHDGKVDYWEYYEGGNLDRIGYDKDGDGKVDVWDRAPAPAAPAAAEAKPETKEGAEQPPAKSE
ncbi:MAG: hypothetical protein IT371_17175 [Deltaproteobacteria bacterium]|nr:hypothetical protein [Deltaproteobacteria bacterium]